MATARSMIAEKSEAYRLEPEKIVLLLMVAPSRSVATAAAGTRPKAHPGHGVE
jgi:hypothetical protein